MTATASKMIGHTLTVERIVDVPELIGTVLHRQATTNAFGGPIFAFIERRDTAFVACHGTNAQRHDLNPYNDHWINCRLLAENMAGLAGPYEDLRYVSLTIGETLPAAVAPAEETPTQNPAEIAPQVAVTLPGTVWRWLADQDLDQVTGGMRAGEVEWRRAMPSATSRRVGRGTVHEMTVSAVAATELAQELSERARMERDMPRADQLIDPRDLAKTAGRIGDQVLAVQHYVTS